MVSINYPSGKKSVLVVFPPHKVLCKAIVDNNNVDNTIVNCLCQSNPNVVVNAVAKLIEDECNKACRRGSGSFLQKSATCLHGRNQEMSALHYITAFILARGGCTQRLNHRIAL